jgi:hypothetical protein
VATGHLQSQFRRALPRGITFNSLLEREELEVFSYALRFTDDFAKVYRDYASVTARYAGNSIFSRWVDRIIEARDTPALNRLELRYWMICCWLHLFLWGYSNEDRMQILIRISAMYPPTQEWKTIKLEPGTIKKMAERLGL